MSKRFLIVFFLLQQYAYSQQVQYFFVIKNKDNQRLPYASLSWIRSAGFSADATGVVSVLSDNKIDTISVANVGYKTLITSITSLEKLNDSFIVILSAQESELPPVTIFSGGRNAEIGIQERQNSFYSNQHRGLIGAIKVVQPSNTCKLESISIFIYKQSSQNIPFRIRIFKTTENGFPGDDLYRENIIIDSYNLGEWNLFDLSEKNIFIDQKDFFIGIEWLNIFDQKKKGLLQVGLTDKIKNPHTYFKYGNRDWKMHSVPGRSDADNLMIKAKIIF